ncbi:MAG: Spy/CpxP family protein refolding chaperone [Planctomycetaceae bacterium]|nr:Spy/CpxP family protein refolding chaperone [Planctomycetaceae bacterium]
MLRLSRWVAVVAILLSASVAFAQRPGGGQPGGGQPGGGRPGGFGGGFGGPGGGSPLTIVNNEAVQKELGLKEEQISKLKALGDEVREDMRGAFGGFQGLQDLSQEEREKKMAEMREKSAEALKKVNEKVKPKLAEILDASQRERLQQLTWQAAGAQAYQNADVIAALKLSKEQQDKLAAITKEFGDKQRDLFPRGGAGGGGERLNFEEMRKKMTELNESRDKQLGEVLTADQKSQFEKLKGKEFKDLAALRGGFGGGRGGPGGANPGGRPQRRPADGDKKAEKKAEN